MKLRLTELSYVDVTLCAFVLAPEVRRIADWRGHFNPFNIYSIIPLLMLVPIGIFAWKSRRGLKSKAFAQVAWVWISAFAYAFIIGLIQTSLLPGLYGFALFVMPMVVGAWLSARAESLEYLYDRLSRILLLLGAFSGAYGILQYALAPPWDTAWMQSVAATAFGLPERFQIRVFSVLNSPATYAEFSVFVFLFCLPRLRTRNWLAMLAILLMSAGILLSLVRAAWLGLLIGTIVYAIVSPRKWPTLAALGVASSTILTAGLLFFIFVPSDQVRDTLSQRFASLGSLDTDYSAQDRQNTGREAMDSAMANLAGHGLGMTGVSEALASSELVEISRVPAVSIDNGFLSRFVEMGIPGFLAFSGAILLALFHTFNALRRRVRSESLREANILAASFTTQIAIIAITISGDTYLGIGSVMFWVLVGLALRPNSDSTTLEDQKT